MRHLIYLLSTGYSGSTLLEKLLGQNPGIHNLGELYKISRHPICSCGAGIEQCPFWKRVAKKLDPAWTAQAPNTRFPPRLFHVTGRRSHRVTTRLVHNAFIAFGSPASSRLFTALSPEISRFEAGCRRALHLFRTISELTDCLTLVDSSKDPVLLRHFADIHLPDHFRVVALDIHDQDIHARQIGFLDDLAERRAGHSQFQNSPFDLLDIQR